MGTLLRIIDGYSIGGYLCLLMVIILMAIGGYCHARMHGLIHDGRLRACPSCLLRVNVRL